MICESKDVADQISYYDMTSEEIALYNDRNHLENRTKVDYNQMFKKDKIDKETMDELNKNYHDDANERIRKDCFLLE